jgi:hypothetical protein
MAPVVPGESVPWGGDGHGFCVSNRPPTRPLPPTNSTARRSPKLLVNCELKLYRPSAREYRSAVAAGRRVEEALLFLFVCGCEVAQD